MEKETGTAPGHTPSSLLLSPSQNLQPNRLEQLQQQESDDQQKALLRPQSQPQSQQLGVACSALVLPSPPFFPPFRWKEVQHRIYEMLMLCP